MGEILTTVSRAATSREGILSETKNTKDSGEKHLLSNPEKNISKVYFPHYFATQQQHKEIVKLDSCLWRVCTGKHSIYSNYQCTAEVPISPDTHSGDNQHIHASSFRSYWKEWLLLDGKTKESKRADKQSTSWHAKAKDEPINCKEILQARTLVFLATEKGELWLSLPFSLQLPESAGRTLQDPGGPASPRSLPRAGGRNSLT